VVATYSRMLQRADKKPSAAFLAKSQPRYSEIRDDGSGSCRTQVDATMREPATLHEIQQDTVSLVLP
jgi:hypothetical protein